MQVLASVLPFLISFLPFFFCTLSRAQLSPSFYAAACPQAVSTVTNTFLSVAKKDNVVAPSTLRLILHDCFVQGCDGSVLLSSTSSNKAERDASDNLNLPQNPFNAIIEAKKAVEQICPGVVSCADILALAARDSVVFLGGPSWEVPLGRLDGRVSTAASVEGRLPGANFDLKQLADNFASVGLSLEDMVILSGAHTIGFSHCDQFKNRLYSFNSSTKVDPSIDSGFVQQLQKKCPASGGDNLQAFDISSPFTFDNSYFKGLQAGKGLLFSDQVLFQDGSTRATVESMAGSQEVFFTKFADAMIKMSAIGAKQGAQGEVRKVCTEVNAGGSNSNSSGGSKAPPPSPTSPPPVKAVEPKSPPPPSQNAPAPVKVVEPKSSPSPSPNAPLPLLKTSPPPLPPSSPPPLPKPLPPQSPPPSPKPLSSPPPQQPSPSPPPPPVVESDPPPPVARDPAPPDEEAPPPPSGGGFTIPGIPGFTPPIHIPFPGFGRGPPPPSSSSQSPAKSSRKQV
ncbi:hypothetical protein L7F22_026481 [Adiantum nelumboides]|nr:hypothetical protein [Adiantum nelumboides]